jgi:hypothetical protein
MLRHLPRSISTAASSLLRQLAERGLTLDAIELDAAEASRSEEDEGLVLCLFNVAGEWIGENVTAEHSRTPESVLVELLRESARLRDCQRSH